MCLPSSAPIIFGKFHNSSKSLAILSHSSWHEGVVKYIGASISKIASLVSLIKLLTVDFPTLYVTDIDCCNSPDAKNRNISDIFCSVDMTSQKFVGCFVMNGFNRFSR